MLQHRQQMARLPKTSLDFYALVDRAFIVVMLKDGRTRAFDLKQIPDAQQTWWLIEKLLKGSEAK